ncbi:LacI family DNA-binding transcriptional regulator [Cellulomonas endometrii]|uniref:LacI family DNA-binding transcriptional regulator n=1 Tax=Cellulomonas endometrii TaxID=3036301 RepID=UPI0031F8BC3A
MDVTTASPGTSGRGRDAGDGSRRPMGAGSGDVVEQRAPGRTTLADVARRAGVSKGTASKALNGRGEVRPETRRRVLEAADALSFTPSVLAQNLASGRTGTVGVLTNDLEGRFVIPILMGAEDALGAGRISVILTDARGDAIREQQQLRTLLERQIDGLIVVGGPRTDPRPSLGQDLPVPVVYAYAPSQDPQDLSLAADNVQAGRLAAEHLWDIGRRHVAYVGGDPTYSASRDREAGAAAALAERGAALLGAGLASGNWTERWGRAAMARLLEQHPDLDAVVAASDQLARAALDILRDQGRRVPEDVAVVGHDNWSLVVTNTRPELTSVDTRLELLGRTAASRLFAALSGDELGSGVELLPVELAVRGSTVADR